MCDKTKEGHFTWVYDETVPMFTHWAVGEPNNHNYNEDCVAVYGGSLAGYWNDDSCKAWNKYICERNEGNLIFLDIFSAMFYCKTHSSAVCPGGSRSNNLAGVDPGEVKWVNFHPPPFL